jgi:8-oxo-dGTP pyrophosphatase MutT (NUDIX family)
VRVIARHFVDGERDGIHELVEPKDAATLIVIDRAAGEPKVLLGQRHARHVFMPGKFVFPGGRVDAADDAMAVASPLHPVVEKRLLQECSLQTAREAQALALAAIRETFEEAGLVIGTSCRAEQVPDGPWAKFAATGHLPNLSCLHFVARAITPPGFRRRFDARFFCADISHAAMRIEGVVHPDAELVALRWLAVGEARRLDLPLITGLVLEELEARLQAGFHIDLPVPFYRVREGEFTRALIA